VTKEREKEREREKYDGSCLRACQACKQHKEPPENSLSSICVLQKKPPVPSSVFAEPAWSAPNKMFYPNGKKQMLESFFPIIAIKSLRKPTGRDDIQIDSRPTRSKSQKSSW
jgi:hypothetical protein